MAEEKSGAVQNKLGQLFIDIGANGLGNLVKGLQSLQANFLLSKKAGEEFIKPFKEMSLNANNAVVNYDKLHAVMGTSLLDIQRWRKAAEITGTPFNTLATGLKNFQQQLLGIRAGLDSKGMQGFALLGIDPNSLDYNKPFENLMLIFRKLQGVNEATRTKVISLLGLSEDLIYFVDKYNQLQGTENRQINENLLLNKQEMKMLREQNDMWNVLKVTVSSAQEKFISKQKWINKLLETTLNWINGTHPILTDMIKEFEEWANNPHPVLRDLFEVIGESATKLLQWLEENRKKRIEELPEKIKEQEEKVEALERVYKKEEKILKALHLPDKGMEEEREKIENEKKKLERLKQEQIQLQEHFDKKEKEEKAKEIKAAKAKSEQPQTSKKTQPDVNYSVNLKFQNENEKTPPLPNVTPSQSSLSYLPRSEQNNINNEKQFTVINNFEQYINGENPQEIADETGRQVSADLTTLYNINQARI